jgi:hypothetical protein
MPRTNEVVDIFANSDAGLLDAASRRDAQLKNDLETDLFRQQQDDNFLADQFAREKRAPDGPAPEDYNMALPDAPGEYAPVGDFSKSKIRLSNYGYSSDSSPDHNSNVLRIGHSNNKLEDGVSAALTKSLARKHGLKTGDMFEAIASNGKVYQRRYDDTVPTTYKGKALPETVDLYDLRGKNNPLFPRLRSGHRLFQRPSPKKQFPSIRSCSNPRAGHGTQ